MTRRLVETVSYLNRIIQKIGLEIEAQQIAVDAKDSGLAASQRFKLIRNIAALERERAQAIERRDNISSTLRGGEGVI